MKKIITAFLKRNGYNITKSVGDFKIGDFYYSTPVTTANYAPWYADEEFLRAYKEIKGFTLVDIYKCYELWQLTEQVISLDDTVSFLEVGVWRGGTASIIAKKISLLHAKSKLYLADTFSGVAGASEKDNYYVGGEHSDTSQELVEDFLKQKIGQCSYTILKGIFPEETGDRISTSEIFGFCHIDVDVYLSAKKIIEWVFGKLIIGGVIVFDDYGFHTCAGVTRLVEEQRKMQDRLIVHNLNGHAIMIKIK
ncbi:MAG TPA: TylF/MycF/NovP-related O-methyltransferase [Segetibacter sp.]